MKKDTSIKWYLRPVTVIIAILSAGALALPLLWISPAFSKKLKVVITLALIALTVWFVKVSVDLYKISLDRIQEIQKLF